MFMTHLECSLTGERYESDRLQNLSKAGKPLLARYNLDAIAACLTREALASRPNGMWKWRELLPLPEGVEPVMAVYRVLDGCAGDWSARGTRAGHARPMGGTRRGAGRYAGRGTSRDLRGAGGRGAAATG